MKSVYAAIVFSLMYCSIGFASGDCESLAAADQSFINNLCRQNPRLASTYKDLCNPSQLKFVESQYEFGNTLQDGYIPKGQHYENGNLHVTCDKQKQLRLDEISVTSVGLQTIPASIIKLTKLRDLWVSDQEFDVNGFPKIFFELKSLTHLSIVNNNRVINQKTLTSISNMLQLKELSIEKIEWSMTNDWLNRLTNLQKLSVELDDTMLPSSMIQLKKLRKLNLTVNNLPGNLGEMVQLQELSFCSKRDQKLPETIKALSDLESLSIQCGWFIKELPVWIGEMKNLKSLSINLTEIKSLPESIKNLHKLEKFSTYQTPLTSLPDIFDQFPKLNDVNLNQTKLTDLPESFGKIHPSKFYMTPDSLNPHGKAIWEKFKNNSYYSGD